MRRMSILFLTLVLISSGLCQTRNNPVFVSTQWLADHLHDRGLVVLQVAFSRPEYRLAHIPGARFLWYDWLVDSTPDASTEMPAVVRADTVLEGLGITDSSTIVLCFAGSNFSTTTRIFLALAYFGLEQRTSILDGGLEMWKAEKRSITTETPVVKRSTLKLHPDVSVITDADHVKATLENPAVVIVDARDKRFYDGNGGGIARTGHIRGARNIPFGAVVDTTNRLKTRDELERLFSEAGIHKGTTIISYCHVGQQATAIFAVARELGYPAVVYDGSFQDWSVRGDDYPIDNPGSNK